MCTKIWQMCATVNETLSMHTAQPLPKVPMSTKGHLCFGTHYTSGKNNGQLKTESTRSFRSPYSFVCANWRIATKTARHHIYTLRSPSLGNDVYPHRIHFVCDETFFFLANFTRRSISVFVENTQQDARHPGSNGLVE